jgi:very-short-patch-repair endonuclease
MSGIRLLLQFRRMADHELHKKGAWRCCIDLASRQDGMVARWQLLELGVSSDQIRRWLRAGMLHRRHYGVYVVGHTALSLVGRQRAALLACGTGAILSHAAAAHLWGLIDQAPKTLDVTVVGRNCRSREDLRLHQVREMDSRDIRRRNGLLITSPARTVVDQAADVPRDELDRLIAEARVKGLLRGGELEAVLARAGSRRGVANVRAFLASECEPDFTRSKGEHRLRGLLHQARLQQPRSNQRVAGYEVDFLWEAEKLVVEFDGFRFHGHRRAFEHDRRKDVDLANAGYLVLRFTWRQLNDEPLAVIAAIARALGRRSLAVA